ncbi:unnamed protein product [Rhizoctonia solani]|nr:unnamed protein product [Rhizoctonia solani]
MIQVVPLRIEDKKVFPMRECLLCAKSPIGLSVVVSERKMTRHLLEVHAIDEPKWGVHYDAARGFKSRFGVVLGYDYRDADDEEPDYEVICDGVDDGSGEESGGEQEGDEEESNDEEYDGEGEQ